MKAMISVKNKKIASGYNLQELESTNIIFLKGLVVKWFNFLLQSCWTWHNASW